MIERLETHGGMPLPPYIKRPRGGDPRDRDDYQTLFARRAGAVAAPTAALHFTDPWLSPAPHPAADGRRYCSTTRSTCSISMGLICARRDLRNASACSLSCWQAHPNKSSTPSTWRETVPTSMSAPVRLASKASSVSSGTRPTARGGRKAGSRSSAANVTHFRSWPLWRSSAPSRANRLALCRPP